MKKLLVLSALLTFGAMAYAQGAPAVKISAGAGVQMDFVGQGQNYEGTYLGYSYKDEGSVTYQNFGFNAFIDATYLVFGVNYGFQLGKEKVTDKVTIGSTSQTTNTDVETNFTYLNLSLLGKYPFNVGPGTVVFPLVGVEYALNLDAKNKSNYTKDSYKTDLNDFYIDLGVGADFALDNLVNGLFVRTNGILGFSLTNSKTMYSDYATGGISYKPGLGLKFTPSLQIGYSF